MRAITLGGIIIRMGLLIAATSCITIKMKMKKIPQLCKIGESLSMWGLPIFINHIENCKTCCKVNLLQVTKPEDNFKYINNKPIKHDVQIQKSRQNTTKSKRSIPRRDTGTKDKQNNKQ